MKQINKTTKIPLIVIKLETQEDRDKFDELQGEFEDILWWLNEKHEQGIIGNDFNPNNLTWQGQEHDDYVQFNLFYEDTGELMKLIVTKTDNYTVEAF